MILSYIGTLKKNVSETTRRPRSACRRAGFLAFRFKRLQMIALTAKVTVYVGKFSHIRVIFVYLMIGFNIFLHFLIIQYISESTISVPNHFRFFLPKKSLKIKHKKLSSKTLFFG